MTQKRFTFYLLSAILLTYAAVAQAQDPFNLQTAGPSDYAILFLGDQNSSNPTDFHLTGPSVVYGNVGVAGPGDINNNTTINGNLIVGDGATIASQGTVTGQVITGSTATSILQPAVNSALNASSQAASASYSNVNNISVPGGQVSGSYTVSGVGGDYNVVDLSGISLNNGQDLTLNGPSNSYFVVNDTGNLTLNGNGGTSGIVLTGGVNPWDVLINVVGTTPSVSFTNKGLLDGILLAPENPHTYLTDGIVNGELITGASDFHINSDSTITSMGPPPGSTPTPEPAFLQLGALLGLGALSRIRRRAAGIVV